MGNIKRKPRKKFIKTMDITKPITLESLGSADDPCFGKHHDPRNGDCQRCGDNEFCALAMGQLTHMKRLEVEKTQKFKDLEEKTIPTLTTEEKKALRKNIKKRIRQGIRMASTVGITKQELVHDIHASYSKDGFTQKAIGKIIDGVVSKSNNIITEKNKYTWSPK